MERYGEGTKFTIDRKIFSSDIWFASPWKLKVWIYLIGNANHSDGMFMGIPVKRGQLIRSYRTIRNDCGYKIGYRMKYPSFDTVRRICEGLTKDERIVQRSVHCGTLFTICNYDNLQAFNKERAVHGEQGLSFNTRSIPVQNNNDKNVKNGKKEKNITLIFPEWLNKDIWKQYCQYRQNGKGKFTKYAQKLAINKLEKLRKEGHNPSDVINQTIECGWSGLFPIKKENIKPQKSKSLSDYERFSKL